MKILKIALTYFLIFCCFFSNAKANTKAKPLRILILLDASSSMAEHWSDSLTRFKAATKIVTHLIDSLSKLDKQIVFGLRVFGHQYPAQDNNCSDTKLEVNISINNITQIKLRLESLHPYGVSPVVYALKEACTNDLISPEEYENRIILITDGGESCGGDLCTFKEELLQKKITVEISVICLINYAPVRHQYSCISKYSVVTKENDMKKTIRNLFPEYSNAIPTIHFSADTSEDGFGYIEISNKNIVKAISLYFEFQGQFILFDRLNIKALYQGQKLQLKTGRYKIIYTSDIRSTPKYMSQEFSIKANDITQIELK